MSNSFTTTKIWSKTLAKLRLLSAVRGTSLVALLDLLADEALSKVDLESLKSNPQAKELDSGPKKP